MKRKQITIIGAGKVGTHIASALIHKNLSIDILLLDIKQSLETAQVLDLKDTTSFFPQTSINEVDFSDKKIMNTDIFIITAGKKQADASKKRDDYLKENVQILKEIKNHLGNIKKTAMILIVSNPVDVLTQIASKIFDLNEKQIFGTGTVLDSSRLYWKLAKKLNKNIEDISGYVLGEHGDSQFIAWSTVNVAEMLSPSEKENIENSVRLSASEIINGKGATYFGIGSVTAEIIESIISDKKTIFSLSTKLNGEYGLKNIVLSLPVEISKNGISKKINLNLSDSEKNKLNTSADKIKYSLKKI